MNIKYTSVTQNDKNILSWFEDNKRLLIFGAHLVSREVALCLESEPFNCNIEAFVVSDKKGNPDNCCGVKVLSLAEASELYPHNMPVVIATMSKYLDSIMEILKYAGFTNIVPMSFESDIWSKVQGIYATNYCAERKIPYQAFKGISTAIQEDSKSATIYSVHSIYDRVLKEEANCPWETEIQVGASLTDKKICDITDDTGDNISEKNRQYCELTGLYWIWKNNNSLVKGICHYRRHFNLSQSDLYRLYDSDIDMLVTEPVLNFPDVSTVYVHDHSGDDWKVMKNAVKVTSPEYLGAFEQMEHGRFYFAYNMFIAKRKTFDDYCSFLFPVLSYCEDNCGIHYGEYQNRYIGFLAERLLIVYMIQHRGDLNVQVTSKHFVS